MAIACHPPHLIAEDKGGRFSKLPIAQAIRCSQEATNETAKVLVIHGTRSRCVASKVPRNNEVTRPKQLSCQRLSANLNTYASMHFMQT